MGGEKVAMKKEIEEAREAEMQKEAEMEKESRLAVAAMKQAGGWIQLSGYILEKEYRSGFAYRKKCLEEETQIKKVKFSDVVDRQSYVDIGTIPKIMNEIDVRPSK